MNPIINVETFETIVSVFKQYTDWHVRRGAVDWKAWDFSQYPKTLAISLDSFDSTTGSIDIGLEFLAQSQNLEDPQVDDSLIVEVTNKLHELLSFLKQPAQQKAGKWQGLVPSGIYLELSDVEYRLQGVSTEINIRTLIGEM